TRRELNLAIDQVQDTVPAMDTFELNLPVEITAGTTRMRRVVALTARRHRFIFPLEKAPDMVRIDPGEWILKELTFEKSLSELRYQLWYDRDVVGRYRAAEQLTRYPDEAAPVLQRALLREPNYWVRERIAETLGEIGRDAAREVLLDESVHDIDPRVRLAAAKALGHYPDADVAATLETLLEQDGNVYVQGAAAEALAAIKADGVEKRLRKLLERDSHSNILRQAAFDGYKALGDPGLLSRAPRYVEYALADGGANRLARTVMGYAMTFRETHRKKVVEVLETALDNPYFRTRSAAARHLATMGARESLPALRAVLESERRSYVRPTLESTVETLEAPPTAAAAGVE
ncbi:MAG: HEAT repeat domain-containing protein, partial [Verrucomicrobiae bacterium]|nr:HEAT repeat domain-containing protein [Verrucomicrobiae bacterium]